MKRLILVEPGLIRATGHEQAHARVLAAECAKRDLPFLVLANRYAEDGVIADLAARRVFHISVYASAECAGVMDMLKTKRAWSRRYRKDFHTAFDRERVGQHDLLLLNTVTISVLDGLGSWLATRRPEERPATAVVFRLGAEEGLPGRRYLNLSRWLYRRSILKLSGQLKWRLLLATDANTIGADFARLTQRPVAAVPLPISVPEPTPPRQRSPLISVAFPSSAYAHKGFALLPDALRIAMGRCSELRATIRVANPPEAMAPVIDQLQAMAPLVHLIRGALPADCYYRMLSAADGILLPYDPVVFAKRSSQILAETAALGRPVIVIAGSFLDRECQRAGIAAVAAEAFTGEALGAALQRFAVDRDILANAAWTSCHRHRHRHSASAFLNQLLSFTRSYEAATSAS